MFLSKCPVSFSPLSPKTTSSLASNPKLNKISIGTLLSMSLMRSTLTHCMTLSNSNMVLRIHLFHGSVNTPKPICLFFLERYSDEITASGHFYNFLLYIHICPCSSSKICRSYHHEVHFSESMQRDPIFLSLE